MNIKRWSDFNTYNESKKTEDLTLKILGYSIGLVEMDIQIS